jgi:hypothetical protein
MTTTITTTDQLVSDLSEIEKTLNRATGKMTKNQQIALFINNEYLSETARIVADGAVSNAFRGLFPGAYEFTHGACANLRVEIARITRK